MSPGEHDDQDDPARRSADPSADMSAEFEGIVAGLRAEGGMPVWPEERVAPARVEAVAPTPAPAPPERERPARAAEEEHFIPPDPPPLPPLGQAAAVGVALLALGVLLLVAPDVLGLSEAAGLTLGLIMLAGGLGWLVLRSWSNDPPEDGDNPGNGAVF